MGKADIFRKFRDDKNGSAYVLAALAIVPMFGMMALAVDYTNHDRMKTDLETASETVALHLAKRVALNPNGDPNDFLDEGKNILEALVKMPVEYDKFVVDTNTGKVQIAAKTSVKTHFMHMFGHDQLVATAKTEARFGRQKIEVAIAIDNSGSMEENSAAYGKPFKTRMDSAKTGARTLIKTASDSIADLENAEIKFSLVPWNHHVRVPNQYLGGSLQNAWWIDWEGKSVDHFRYLAPYVASGSNKGDMYFAMPRRKSGWPEATSDEWVYYDPNKLKDYLPLIPSGNGVDLQALKNKSNIALVTRKDVFDRFYNASWKGCFDHRAGNYREKFDAPNADVGNSLYLPHFAPDEYDYDYDQQGSDYWRNWRINYIDDIRGDSDYSWNGSNTLYSTDEHDAQHLSVKKYGYGNYYRFSDDDIYRARTFNTPKYAGSGQIYTRNTTLSGSYGKERVGPDMDCIVPPLLGLSNDVDGINNNKADGALSKAIKGMKSNGATDLSIGISWAMNTMTPWEPMAGAGSFEDTQKVLVIMTDGDNTINFPNAYAYGHSPHGYAIDNPYNKNWGLYGPSNAEQANAMLDDVSKSMCTNIKAMGVRIYFIYFGSAKYSTRAGSLKDHCASTPQNAIWAKNDDDLQSAFEKIGDDIGRLRLTHYSD